MLPAMLNNGFETFGSVMESYEIAPLCESPIETRFGSRLSESLRQIAALKKIGYVILKPGDAWPGPCRLLLRPQFKTDRSRFDFAVQLSEAAAPFCLIECDGRDFHSTAKQFENDRRKDAEARAMGALMHRFTGSEIHKNVDWCVAQVLTIFFAAR